MNQVGKVFVAILIGLSVTVHFNVAQARTVALACGKQLQKQCGGMPVLANNLRECLQKSQRKNFRKMRWIGEQCCAQL